MGKHLENHKESVTSCNREVKETKETRWLPILWLGRWINASSIHRHDIKRI